MTLNGIAVYICLRAVRVFLAFLDFILDSLWGYSILCGSRSERALAASQGCSAHVSRVIVAARTTVANPPHPEGFLSLHEEYVKPELILENPHVTLFACERDAAWFCWTLGGDDIYRTAKYPFVFTAQMDRAIKVVRLPIAEFHRIASVADGERKRRGVTVGVIAMSGRCGSTLLTQMFAK